ncbi:MAG TPA: hypothetical protein PLP25_12320, partial [Candidatus Limiplasma sp.]|nr:hypothetical protein [Candidatus Limiplasma sp.]
TLIRMLCLGCLDCGGRYAGRALPGGGFMPQPFYVTVTNALGAMRRGLGFSLDGSTVGNWGRKL